jgi:ABC-type transporter Mla subunit MlaD
LGGGEAVHRRHRAFFVGLFVIVPAIVIPLLLVYTLGKSELLQDWRTLHVLYESSHGLARGDAVTVSDIRVGHVKSVDLTAEGKAFVTLKILRRHAHLVRKDSRAALTRKSMVVGDWTVSLTGGSEEYPPVEENDTLAGEPPFGFDLIIDRATSMVATLEELLREASEGKGLVAHLIRDDTLVNVIYAVLGDVRRIASTTQRTMRHAEQAVDRFDKLGEAGIGVADSLQVTIDSVEAAISDARVLLENLGGASEQLPGMFDQAIVDLHEIEILLKGLQRHWLFRRSVRKEREESAEPVEGDE